MEAPPEFEGVGSTISQSRRINAEDGAVHRTARKLGALFEAIIPSTPALYKAYGTRVSEISQSKKINPKPSSRDGMFASHIGADSTSLWTAVTSGDGAIGVHLLACMLARIWTPPQAISIWHELVEKRKEEIQSQNTTATYPSKYDSSVLASKQEISRESLAGWEASARAWVQSADQVEYHRHTQMMLILDNINVPVNSETNLYHSVTQAWFAALRAMESLVSGVPQQVQDGAALLGISSWHLYPDMVVLGGVTTEVKQQDTIFPSSAILTLGLQFADPSRHGVSWSLPLAHLRYYGHPVQASCSVGPANSRISMTQFSFVILGCIFGGWKEYGSTADRGISWLLRLRDLLEAFPKYLKDIPETANEFQGVSTSSSYPRHSNLIWSSKSWMGWLFVIGQRFREMRGLEKQRALQLVALGKRRTAALCPENNIPSPLFGLSDPSILIPILKNGEARVRFLRGLAEKMALPGAQHIIRYRRDELNLLLFPYEYASARPLPKGPGAGFMFHKRFLPITAFRQDSTILGCACLPKCFESCPCRLRTTECSLLCHHQEGPLVESCGNNGFLGFLRQRSSRLLEEMEEIAEPVCELLAYRERIHVPDILIKFGSGSSFESTMHDLSRKSVGTPLRNFVGLKFVCGDPDTAALYELDYSRNVITPGAPIESKSDSAESYVQEELLSHVLKTDMLDFERLTDWLITFKQTVSYSKTPGHSTAPGFTQAISQIKPPPPQSYSEYSTSLRAGVVATDIYKLLPDATISTTVVSQSLWLSKWLPNSGDGSHLISEYDVSRPQALACIAMFDSGLCNLDPAGLQEAFALVSGNSIYVAAPLLCDPFEVPAQREIRRVTGSIGRPGITVLVPPGEPKIRNRDDESWLHVNHTPFDGKLENCFQQTTIHLGFTAYELPLSDGSHGQHIIDRPANLVETVVSVHDRGKWIADLDVLSALNRRAGDGHRLKSLLCECRSQNNNNKRKAAVKFEEIFDTKGEPLVCIDNWDEFLDLPAGSVPIVRAYQNWLARLAFTVLSVNHGQRTLVLPEDVCWLCCKDLLHRRTYSDSRSLVLIC